ncbi:MAG: M15 family metallopeptidase [Alkalispirochaeta sp.]
MEEPGRENAITSHRSVVWGVQILLLGLIIGNVAPADEAASIPQWGHLDGFIHLRAYQTAYPERVEAVAFRDGDWTIRVNGTWFYWANGRLLPEKARAAWERFAPARLYRYETGPYRIPSVPASSEALLERWVNIPPETLPHRHNGFLGVLYGALSAGQARHIMVTIDWFGFSVRVHPIMVEPLHAVERDTRAIIGNSPEVLGFLRGLAHVDGQLWRYIAGTRSLSYHSYGTAVDLIPARYNGQFSYWRWAAQAGVTRWWDVRMDQRWIPPMELVEIFERHGFVWGGRWLFFDSIHFEYRPEIHEVNELIRNRYTLAGSADQPSLPEFRPAQ